MGRIDRRAQQIKRYIHTRGFTLLEVTFATGILFLTFILLMGSLAQLASVRGMAERRHLAVLCLNHCVEQVRALPRELSSVEGLRAPAALPGAYEIRVEPLADSPSSGMVRVTVVTQTTRGREIVVSAVCAPGVGRDAP